MPSTANTIEVVQATDRAASRILIFIVSSPSFVRLVGCRIGWIALMGKGGDEENGAR
jgi:hypothetical protein